MFLCCGDPGATHLDVDGGQVEPGGDEGQGPTDIDQEDRHPERHALRDARALADGVHHLAGCGDGFGS